MKRKVSAVALVLGGMVAGLMLGPGQTASAQVQQTPAPVRVVEPVKVKVIKVKVKPPVGKIMTSSGRIVNVNTKDGCFVLRYTELTKQKVGDPGDGEWYCAR